MRFEVSVALRYLIPRWRSLSVSMISLVSIVVISLVVWLAIVFLSVTEGIENQWVDQLVALNAPVRLSPTEAYYDSYSYQVDQHAFSSGYLSQTLGEKRQGPDDPFDPLLDAPLPESFPDPLLNPDGQVVNLAKEAWEAIDSLSNVRAQEYEVAFGNFRISAADQDSFLNQASYVASLDEENERLQALLLPPFASEEHPDRLCLEEGRCQLPSRDHRGDGVLLPKTYIEHGVSLGDVGTLSYYAEGASGVSEQRLPVFVAGFFDPGLVPLGNKLILADGGFVARLRSGLTVADKSLGNGIHLWTEELTTAPRVKKALQAELDARGIAPYFEVATFMDYEFARPILEQLKSDKNLFTLIAIIILIVACSNIISMLVLLVNAKRKEIGILLSLGASPKKIACIFGLCGLVTGLLSALVGTFGALFTLRHLQSLVNFLSFLQGHEAFQSAFYGSTLPSDLSGSALLFVISATIFMSLVAGSIPAIKAARIRPSEILRAE